MFDVVGLTYELPHLNFEVPHPRHGGTRLNLTPGRN